MDGNGSRHTLTDSELDREIEVALGIEPSPEFHARVRTRVAAEPDAPWWRPGVVGPLSGLALAGIVLALVVPGSMRQNPPAHSTKPAVSSAQAHAQGEAEKPPVANSAERVVRSTHPARATRPAPVASETLPRLSRPLFSEDERRALIALVTAVEEGRVPPRPAITEATDHTGAMRELRIDPLVIEPLPLVARLEELGASQ